jgi:superfamily II DNA or RNA helicase
VRTVPVIVDSHLRLDGNLIGHDIANDIFDDLTIHNHAKDVAERMNRWGWQDLPDDFQLGDLDGDTVVMPRGYALALKEMLRDENIRVQWVERRQWQRGSQLGNGALDLKPHQALAVRHMIKHQQGMYEAPTGSGKTVACIGFIARVQPMWTIILVDKLDLLHQWRKQLAKFLGVGIDNGVIGQIGDGKWELGSRITVATVQTLTKMLREGELPEAFFEVWDAVILDECHHVTAETIRELLSRFYAKYRLGVSATTDRQDEKFPFALNVLGEVFYKDDEEELRESGLLMRPRVQVVRTGFEHPYWPDHESDEDDKCQVPGCKLSGKRPHWHRNNYHQVKASLIENKDRNRIVIGTLLQQVKNGDHHHLIVSNEVKHLGFLMDMLIEESTAGLVAIPEVYVMTGQVRGVKRSEMKAEIERASAAIIFATVAKEGLDIPPVDRIYLPFPESNPKATQQKIGRGTRIHEGKVDTVVFDFFDILIDVFRKQFRNRRFKCYDQMNMEVDLGD